MSLVRYAIVIGFAIPAIAAAQDAPAQKCEGIPPGRHANLERMTAGMNLTCPQQLKIEPLLHEEESVSKPLQAFASFSDEQRGAVMDKVKVAARRRIRQELTAEQQPWMDKDIDSVKAGKGGGGGKKGGGKSAPAAASSDPLAPEETLSKAVMEYSALSPAEKTEIVVQVKKAARADSNLSLSAEQQKKLDAEIADLSKH